MSFRLSGSGYGPSSAVMGYDVDRFISTVNDGLLCSICRDVLEDPLQAPCEHAYCSACIRGWLVQENTCPEDRQPLRTAELRPLYRYMRNDLARLQIRCRNVSAGCATVTSLEIIAAHESECAFDTLECPSTGCDVRLERRAMEEHLSVCEFRRRECPKGCGLPLLSTDDEGHSCIAELRTALELLRSEMICKIEDQKHETELRLDAQRRHMVQKEAALGAQLDDVRAELSRLSREMAGMKTADQVRAQELARTELEKRELIDVIKTIQKEMIDSTKKHTCKKCARSERITVI